MKRFALGPWLRTHPALARLACNLASPLFPSRKWKVRIERALEKHRAENGPCSRGEARAMRRDMAYCLFRWQVTPEEYFLFRFPALSEKGRGEYIGDLMKDMLCHRFETPGIKQIFKDKHLTYKHFGKYFGRECALVGKDDGVVRFREFLSRHGQCMVKALEESKGHGVFKYTRASIGEGAEKVGSLGDCLLEEVIEQAPELARFHPQSVNTVRFGTIHAREGIVELFAELRMGCGDSFVDNAGAGGIVAPIDLESGIISGVGRREDGQTFVFHPDTHEQIVGARMPEWGQLRALVRELAAVVPEQRYVGWDIARSTAGWILVEANERAQMIGYQLCAGHGIRKTIEKIYGLS